MTALIGSRLANPEEGWTRYLLSDSTKFSVGSVSGGATANVTILKPVEMGIVAGCRIRILGTTASGVLFSTISLMGYGPQYANKFVPKATNQDTLLAEYVAPDDWVNDGAFMIGTQPNSRGVLYAIDIAPPVADTFQEGEWVIERLPAPVRQGSTTLHGDGAFDFIPHPDGSVIVNEGDRILRVKSDKTVEMLLPGPDSAPDCHYNPYAVTVASDGTIVAIESSPTGNQLVEIDYLTKEITYPGYAIESNQACFLRGGAQAPLTFLVDPLGLDSKVRYRKSKTDSGTASWAPTSFIVNGSEVVPKVGVSGEVGTYDNVSGCYLITTVGSDNLHYMNPSDSFGDTFEFTESAGGLSGSKRFIPDYGSGRTLVYHTSAGMTFEYRVFSLCAMMYDHAIFSTAGSQSQDNLFAIYKDSESEIQILSKKEGFNGTSMLKVVEQSYPTPEVVPNGLGVVRFRGGFLVNVRDWDEVGSNIGYIYQPEDDKGGSKVAYIESTINNSQLHVYSPWMTVFDSTIGAKVEISGECEVIAAAVATVKNYEPWFAYAGPTRGKVNRAMSLAIEYDQDDRDLLNSGTNIVNPIAKIGDSGFLIYGNKTSLRDQTKQLTRVHIRDLQNYIQKVVAKLSLSYVFEPNDSQTWTNWRLAVNGLMETIKKARGVYEYTVIMSPTDEEIDQFKMPGVIKYKPIKDAEEIVITFVLKSKASTL